MGLTPLMNATVHFFSDEDGADAFTDRTSMEPPLMLMVVFTWRLKCEQLRAC
jgi:hypothetical protein